MRKGYKRTGMFLAALGLAGCSAGATSSDGEDVESTGQAATSTCAMTPLVGQSLFLANNVTTFGHAGPVNTPNPFGKALLRSSSFSFLNVMKHIVISGGADVSGPGGAEAAALALYQQMVGTLNAPVCTGTINGFPVDCPPEGQIATTNPFTGTDGKDIMVPTAVVNRFDLAPSDGSNCGEFRIVYAINPQEIEFADRFLMIFEGTLPNPTPAKGITACLPVAQLWDNLSAPGTTVDTLVSTLVQFYFEGITVNGVQFAPVVQAQNYGFGFPNNADTGQVRVNMLADQPFADWELRQFELSQACPDAGGPCTVTATNTFVTNNPFAGLFETGGGSDPTFEAQFPGQVGALAAGSIPGISMSTPQQDNGGESDESGLQLQNYLTAANGNTTLIANIQKALDAIPSTLTPSDILNRATTQSCAGCHQISTGTKLGGGLTWPDSNGFVQVEETTGQQSIALANFFLPFRAKVLTKFINKHCAGAGAGADEVVAGETVAGTETGGAN
jgi:hypothetical protein